MEWKGIKGAVLRNISMKRYTSMRVGGPASYLIYPQDEKDLLEVLHRAREEGIEYRIVGNGTNIIVHDAGVNEALIRMTRVKHKRYRKTQEGAFSEVSGGISLKGFITDNARHGFSGLEKLYWIPGTIGGGIKMNAGSFGSWISDTLDCVRLVDREGAVVSLRKDEMDFGYRTSRVRSPECVLSASFRLRNRRKEDIQKDMDYVYGERKKRHPMDVPSAGSVFKSVGGEPAWKFIEKAGLKGISVGGAMISEKHANFIVNTGDATATDVKVLLDRIKKEVFEKTGTTLEEEIELWGFHG